MCAEKIVLEANRKTKTKLGFELKHKGNQTKK
jgi:hypothetical protein